MARRSRGWRGKTPFLRMDSARVQSAGNLARAEIRFKSRAAGFCLERGESKFSGNLLPAKVPKHSPQFVLFVETDPMIDGIEFMRIVLEEDVAAFSVRVVAEQVKEHDGLEELPVLLAEAEVMIFGIVFDELLERTRAIGTVVTERGEWDNVKAK